MNETEWFEGFKAEDELERCQRRRFALWLSVVLALVIGAGIVTCHASEIYRDRHEDGSPVAYRLTDKPCTDKKVRAYLYMRLLDDRRFRAGILTWKGKDWASCWIEIRGTVHSIDEEGAPFQPVLRKLFKDESI